MAAGIFINPWTTALWLGIGGEFSVPFRLVLSAACLLAVVCGFLLFMKKRDFFSWAGGLYRDTAVILLNMALLFGAINVAAFFYRGQKAVPPPGEDAYVVEPGQLFAEDPEFLRNVYPGKSDEDIRELLLLRQPFANHPVLEFQELPQRSKHYNVGFEGIRYDSYVTRSNAPGKINGAIWVLGGSTTFGQGVSDNETIPYYLNRLDPGNTYINFAVHAYHQSNEIEKLVLLLRKGYVPKKVIFIDGLNDVARVIQTNYHPAETPALAKSAYGSDYNIVTGKSVQNWLQLLPALKMMKAMKADGTETVPWTRYDDVYDAESFYHRNPERHFRETVKRSPYSHIDPAGLEFTEKKLAELYRLNINFIDRLSKAYGFEYAVFFQPQGALSAENPFWRNKATFRQTPIYRNFNHLISRMSGRIKAGEYKNFYDITGAHDNCLSCYVDLTHYNPRLNERIAAEILAILGRSGGTASL
jgi:hypothetical protein